MQNINIKNNPGFLLGIAVVVFALIFLLAAKGFSKQASYVEVKGLSERIVKADTAIWSMNFEVKSNNVDEMYATIDKNISSIKTYLTQKGFTEEEINVGSPNIYQDTYREALFRYNANVQVSVYTKKVDQVRAASKDTLSLLKSGIAINQNNINYEFSGLNDIKPEMLGEAIKNARVSAEQFAKDSGSSIGNISRANQGVFDITEKDPSSPDFKKIRVVSTLRFLLK
jgi:uncharacterized protein